MELIKCDCGNEVKRTFNFPTWTSGTTYKYTWYCQSCGRIYCSEEKEVITIKQEEYDGKR